VSTSPDHTAAKHDPDPLMGGMEAHAAAEIAHEMVGVAGALFGLLLPRAGRSIHQDLPSALVVRVDVVDEPGREPAAVPLAIPAPENVPIALPQTPVPSLPVPTMGPKVSLAPGAAPTAGALPATIPVPAAPVDAFTATGARAEPDDTQQPTSAAADGWPPAVATVAPVSPHAMAMLSEIGFLDD